jgi:hypothetical protein
VLGVNTSQFGRFEIKNVNVSPGLGSLAVGVNVYCVPTCPVGSGVPEIVGGAFGGGGGGGVAVTVIVNAGRFAVAVPSLTLILMFE